MEESPRPRAVWFGRVPGEGVSLSVPAGPLRRLLHARDNPLREQPLLKHPSAEYVRAGAVFALQFWVPDGARPGLEAALAPFFELTTAPDTF